MTAVYMQKGEAIDYTPSGAVEAGQVVVLNDLVGIAKQPIPANRLGALAVTGVFSCPKNVGSDEAIETGTTLYWDETNEVATDDSDSGANKLLGKAGADAGDDDLTVLVRLTQ